MASAWIVRRTTKNGSKRYRVEYRLGGRESATRYAGSFKRRADAEARKRWVFGELAAMRVPDPSVTVEPPHPVLDEAADAWVSSRIDVLESTQVMHRNAIARIFRVRPGMRSKRIDRIDHNDMIDVIAGLVEKGYRRGTIQKSRTAMAMIFDHFEITPNPARHKKVKLPRERPAHHPPPVARDVERVALDIPKSHVLPFLILDQTGARVSILVNAQVDDVDEERQAIRSKLTLDKTDRYRLLCLSEDLFDALLETLPPKAERDLAAALFPELTDARLRTAIAKACRRTGTQHFSPHALRRRRGSLHYKKTGSLAEVAELLGDSQRVARLHYMYAMTDYSEVDRTAALARIRDEPTSVPPSDS